jgi:signal peptidase II
LAQTRLKPLSPPEYSIIDGMFSLYYSVNDGAGFGILRGQWVFLSVMSIVIMTCLVGYFAYMPKIVRQPRVAAWLRAALVLIFGGALGNLVDRLSPSHSVVDFFYFKLINFAIFNVADVFVVCGSFLLLFLVVFFVKEEPKKNG